MWGATPELALLHHVKNISIHAPRVGGDSNRVLRASLIVRFQSTPPVWGATGRAPAEGNAHHYFNPRPPCGGRQEDHGHYLFFHDISIHAPRVGGDDRSNPNHQRPNRISIHAPRVGGDLADMSMTLCSSTFQSTPPVWGATHGAQPTTPQIMISIHAPRVGGDCRENRGRSGLDDFNPRPPCGGRQATLQKARWRWLFQSTPPVWGATRPSNQRGPD